MNISFLLPNYDHEMEDVEMICTPEPMELEDGEMIFTPESIILSSPQELSFNSYYLLEESNQQSYRNEVDMFSMDELLSAQFNINGIDGDTPILILDETSSQEENEDAEKVIEDDHIISISSAGEDEPPEFPTRIIDRRTCFEESSKSPDFTVVREQLFKCQVCSREFLEQSNLSRHEAEHAVTRHIKCSFCHKTFKHESHRTMHMRHCPNLPVSTDVIRSERSTETNQAGMGLENDTISHSESATSFNEILEQPRLIQSALSNTVIKYEHRFDKSDYVNLFIRIRAALDKYGDIIIKEHAALSVNFHQAANVEDVTSPPVIFRSEVFTSLIDDENNRTKFVIAMQQLTHQIEEFLNNGSGWVLSNIVKIDVGIINYKPLRGSSYLPLPKKLIDTHAIINIQNKDEKCFIWSILASLYPADRNRQRMEKYSEFENNLIVEGLDFPMKVRDIPKFESMNNISINVLGYEGGNVFPLYLSSIEEGDHHVNLIYYTKGTVSHYALINNLSRLVSSQVSEHEHEVFPCKFCLHCCTTQERLRKHMETCGKYGMQRAECLTKDDEKGRDKVKFTKIEAQLKLPFVIYADFEALLPALDHEIGDNGETWTVKKAKHTPNAYAIYTKSSDERFYRDAIMYRGEDAAEKFLDDIQNVVSLLNR